MRLTYSGPATGLLLACLLWPAASQACDAIEDGCLGCRDEELPACLDDFVGEICAEAREDEFCNEARVRDDVERLIIMNTGRHMSDVRALARSARKYFRRHPIRP